jgi:hypothetical protein
MLEFASSSFSERKITSSAWKRSLILGALGLFGGLLLPTMIRRSAASVFPPEPIAPISAEVVSTPYPIETTPPKPIATPIVVSTPAAPSQPPAPTNYFDFVVEQVTDQPFLWYRLLPNSTYDYGILLALVLASIPITIILIYLSRKKIWQISNLQKLSLVLPLLAFLIVGLVASTKIGGGGDLHNMDMFLIGMLFAGTVAWQSGGREWIQNGKVIPALIKILIVALIINSSIGPLFEMRSFTLGNDATWLRTLTDAEIGSTMDMLPTQEKVDDAIQIIQQEADKAKSKGDVLFMDQRQLLTFGYIKGIPLIPEYEKKIVMNQALSSNAAYFQGYYADLAAKRFSLIITEPLRTPVQDSTYQFGEENNAWVKWVANPTLCYYEPVETLKTVRVQLLVPKQGNVDCSIEIP